MAVGENEAQMNEWAEFFYKSHQWRRMKQYVLKRDREICQDCGGHATEVHHIIPLSPENIMDPSITLDENNLVSLCADCHRKRHGGVT